MFKCCIWPKLGTSKEEVSLIRGLKRNLLHLSSFTVRVSSTCCFHTQNSMVKFISTSIKLQNVYSSIFSHLAKAWTLLKLIPTHIIYILVSIQVQYCRKLLIIVCRDLLMDNIVNTLAIPQCRACGRVPWPCHIYRPFNFSLISTLIFASVGLEKMMDSSIPFPFSVFKWT